jgi:tetratricopeptide (TPR) repeat protein
VTRQAPRRFDFPTAELAKRWSRLHRGDCEPYPDAAWVGRITAAHPGLAPKLSTENAAAALQAAWRAYHHGDFEKATQLGVDLGPLGYNAANKAANIRASYLEQNEHRRLALLTESVQRAETLQAAAPDLANAWYFHAQALGRYSQAISITRALAEGLAGKVRASLERSLALAPNHAEAHIAFGAYHAEVVAKVGTILARLTYGASREAALHHFGEALRLIPPSAIARIEYAQALVRLFGRDRLDEAKRLYSEASACEPADEMERLDAAFARESLES